METAKLRSWKITRFDPDAPSAADLWVSADQAGEEVGGRTLTREHVLAVEDATLRLILEFHRESGAPPLVMGEVEDHWEVNVPLLEKAGFPAPGRPEMAEGRIVEGEELGQVIRCVLRGLTWCRLHADGLFSVFVAMDGPVFVLSHQDCPRSVALARELGLSVRVARPPTESP